jgi:hypothetical protein
VWFLEAASRCSSQLGLKHSGAQSFGSHYMTRLTTHTLLGARLSKRFLVVYVGNEPLPRGLRWMTRSTATLCSATLEFCREDGQRLLDSPISGRWAAAPEPTNDLILVNGSLWGEVVRTSRPSRDSRLDIPPDAVEELSIAAMFDDEKECYAWNDESYSSTPTWRHPDRKMSPGTYLVFVTVRSEGESVVRPFRLVCDMGRPQFRLIQARKTDPAKPI